VSTNVVSTVTTVESTAGTTVSSVVLEPQEDNTNEPKTNVAKNTFFIRLLFLFIYNDKYN
jgi:hypothetical protein